MPTVASQWAVRAGDARWLSVDATLCFVDISGFTRLSERLAQRGRIGAEELTQVLSRVFGSMTRLAYERGGSLIKFGGDALLLLFEHGDHAVQAASAAVEMRQALHEAARIPTSVGRVPLRMSVGLHTGVVDLYRVGDSHRELVIAGPAATTTIEMESTAEAGQIVVSDALRDRLHRSAPRRPAGDGWLLGWRRGHADPVGVRPGSEHTPETIAECVPVALRTHLSEGRAEPEHRVAVVGFVKFRGTDRLHAERGGEAVADALEVLIGAAQLAVDDNGVTFLATDIDADGGKIILTTGVPTSTEDDERRMLRAVRAVVDLRSELELRAGISRGHVFAGEVGTDLRSTFTVMGDTVNIAARLMAAAPSGAAYVMPDVLDRSPTLFETQALDPLHVKGKAAPISAYELGSELVGRDRASSDELAFVGRDAELGALCDRLARVRSGDGGVVGIVGEAGAGKTRLTREALATADDLPVLVLRGEPYGSAMPYRPLRDAVREMLGIERGSNEAMAAALAASVQRLDPTSLPLLPLVASVCQVDVPPTVAVAAIDPEFRSARTADLVTHLAGLAAPGPAVVIVEDAHWMDDASALLLARMAGAAVQNRWLYLVTRRDEEGGYVPDADRVIDLQPLDPGTARALIVEATAGAPLRPHEVEAIVERAAGNPLFIESIVRSRDHDSIDTMPGSLGAVVSAQIDDLPPLTRRLLRYSAVLGVSFRRPALRALLAEESIVLDEATRADLGGFLEVDGHERLRFRHQIVRDAAYEGLSFRRRRQLHRAAAAWYLASADDDLDAVADVLSLHFAMAGEDEETWRFARAAASRAARNAANAEAVVHYQRALASARRLPALARQDVVETWTDLGVVLELSGQFEAALEAYRRARHELEEADDVAAAGLLLREARALERAGRFSQALRTSTRTRRLVAGSEGSDAQRLDAQTLAFRAVVRAGQERPAQALDLAEAAIEAATACSERSALAHAYTVVDWAHRVLGRPDLVGLATEALAIYEELDDRKGVATVSANLAFEAYFTGDWDAALAYQRRATRAFTELGDTVRAAMCDASIGEILVGRRASGEAEDLLAAAARAMRASGFVDGAAFAEITLARAWLQVGRVAEAAELLDSVIADAEELGLTATVLEASVHRAACEVAVGDWDAALSRLAGATDLTGEHGAVLLPTASRVEALALSGAGRLTDARSRLEEGVAAATDQDLAYELFCLFEVADVVEPGGDVEARRRADELADRLGIDTTVAVGPSPAASVRSG